MACERVDAQCGLLNCQLGSDKPSINSESFFKATTSTRGVTNECKVITSEPSVYVNDGTRCEAEGHEAGVCVSQKCVPVERILSVATNKCSAADQTTLCSNNGVCDNLQKCRCLPGWTGKYCETFSQGEGAMMATKNRVLQRDETLNMVSNLNGQFQLKTPQVGTVTLLSIVGGVTSLLLIIFLVLFLICQRRGRRQRSSLGKKPISKSHFNPVDTTDSVSSTLPRLATSMATSSSSSLNQSQSSAQNISLTKVNHAIKQLKAKPSKSILKKNCTVNDEPTMALNNSSRPAVKQIKRTAYSRSAHETELDSSINDSAIKFERQVHKNTLLNSAIGVGHRISRRSMTAHGDGRRDLNESFDSNSSAESENQQINSSEISISSDLSNTNMIEKAPELVNKKKVPDLSFLTSSSGSSAVSSRRNSSSSSISLQLLEPRVVVDHKSVNINSCDEQKTDFLKVQDYLNELNMLSQQNTFRIESEMSRQGSTASKPTTSTFKSKENSAASSVTPLRPESLLTPIKKPDTAVNRGFPEPNRLSQILTTSPIPTGYNAGQQMLLHLQILRQQNPDDLVNVYTSTSETSSGYLSNSTQNLNLESGKTVPFKGSQQQESSYNSSTCSSSLTPPMPACLIETNKNLICSEKRFSYMAATTGSSNTLNIDQ